MMSAFRADRIRSVARWWSGGKPWAAMRWVAVASVRGVAGKRR